MNRLITIVRREYLERVRSKAFMVSTFLGPVLVAGFMLGPSLHDIFVEQVTAGGEAAA